MSEPLSPPSSTDALLSALLANFGTKPAKAPRKAGSRALPKNASPLPFHKEFAEKKTGYTTWVAQAKVIILEEQTCECCGAKVTAVKDELFLLTHSVSHSAWLRHEGYGIEASEDLPIRPQYLPPRVVSACAACFTPGLSEIFLHLYHEQVQLHLPL